MMIYDYDEDDDDDDDDDDDIEITMIFLRIQAVQPASQPASQPVSQSAKPASQQASDELAIRLVNPASCGPACIGAINKRSAMALELARLKELLLTSTLV
uniref:Uncharacterized protein n=1 Tax=Vespula pensylvanica TaxID=30213 RepID=A0A834P1K4_VESPE|nr:hypothetical protein H0235_008985 [Vespula pensylvanica]